MTTKERLELEAKTLDLIVRRRRMEGDDAIGQAIEQLILDLELADLASCTATAERGATLQAVRERLSGEVQEDGNPPRWPKS